MEIEQLPELEHPTVIAAFSGWNDAGQSATTAVRYLIDAWKAEPFAKMDPEDFYSFTDTRPTIKIADGNTREIVWPTNEFFAFRGNTTSPAAVMMSGVEPNFKWRTYCGEIIRLARSVGARRLVTLGSIVTDAVHTRPVPLTGFSTEEAVQSKFVSRGIGRSNYEGPTGIIGVLHNACRDAELPVASMWAATPYYLGGTPNPKTAYGLLDALDESLGLKMNLGELRAVANEFERQVSAAVRDNAEVQQQIRALEERYDTQGSRFGGNVSEAPPAELPDSGTIIADLEDYLRGQRDE